MRIRQYVLDLMREHRNTDVSILSERELCRKFGVTRPTARKALKALIEEDYLYVKPGRGMFVRAERLEAAPVRRFKRIMVVIGDGGLSCMDGFFMSVLEKLCGTLKHLPVHLQVVPLDVDHDCAVAEIEMYNPDGILWVRPGEKGKKLIGELREKIPVVTLGLVPDGDPYAVTCDYTEAGRLSAQWFRSRALKKIVFLQDRPGAIRESVYNGWRSAFPGYDESLHYRDRTQENEQSSVRELVAFLESRKIDGIFTFASYYPVLDAALKQTGKTGIPILSDNNYCNFYQVATLPSVELRMFPSEVPEAAAKLMFRILIDPGFKPKKEKVIRPGIRDFPPPGTS
ncbi:MAG: putative HTH-type transcriptional regulator YurK [Lentisphaerae bacterium ADurb.Bin242]|nr:MAG: putative HTH-type transcriptional regulator YurK [Lentisphaerae bacterium ADurb.Bin242]